jgi:hypothetical protein
MGRKQQQYGRMGASVADWSGDGGSTRRSGEGPSKTVLLVIEALGLGAFGIDRMYMGMYLSGFAKLALLLMVAPLYQISSALSVLAFTVWSMWAMVDSLWVFINAIAGSNALPLGATGVWDSSPGDVNTARTVAVVMLFFHLSGVSVGAYFSKDFAYDVMQDARYEVTGAPTGAASSSSAQ